MDKKDLANTYTFAIDFTAPSGENFKGSFIVHRPTVGERIKIGVSEARELGGLINVDWQTSNLARIVSTLDVVIDKAPTWWKPNDILELEVLQEVYDKYVDYLQTFQRKPEQTSETTG